MRYIMSIVSVIILISIFLYINHAHLHKPPTYVGSSECQSCHQLQHTSFESTLHPVIFQPVSSLKQIVGDFDTPNNLVNFKKEDVEYIVGTKWEQVYMRIIDDDYYPFTAKWMITTQKWVPYKVHDWMKTPASQKCNGCHTTGYNKNDHSFNEFGVQCEACHGPASDHVAHTKMSANLECKVCHKEHQEFKRDIIVSQKSSVCGQCHSRGTTSILDDSGKKTVFNFPLEYVLGEEADKNFKQTSLKNDVKRKNWWGNGISKNRHQEYADFSFSGHAKALENLHTKKNPHGGVKNDQCLKCHSQDYRSAKDGEKPTLKTAKLGLTCITCHEPHGIDKQIRSQSSVDKVCAECHTC